MMLRRFVLGFFMIAAWILFGFLFLSHTHAQSLYTEYPSYEVTVVINEDGSFTVTEDIVVSFTGELNGLRRDITLEDVDRDSRCQTNSTLTCGGFDYLTFDSFVLEGEVLEENEYKLYEVEDDWGDRYFRIEKRLHDPAENVVDETWEWSITYTVYGGIQRVYNTVFERVPFLYWNILPESRGGNIADTKLRVVFPENIQVAEDRIDLLTSYNALRTFDTRENAVEFSLEDVSSYGYVTVVYEFLDSDLPPTGSIQINQVQPMNGVQTTIAGRPILGMYDTFFNTVPAGSAELLFTRFGYEDETNTVSVEPDQVTVVAVDMTPEPWMGTIIFLSGVIFVLGAGMIPYAAYRAYRRYRLQGRDKNMPKTIVPEFSPPKNMPPYVLGSLVDEKVDNRDITGMIIDLAYRGHLSIKELDTKGKDYELTRHRDNKDELTLIESAFLKKVFSVKKSRRLSTLKSSSILITALQNARRQIYGDLVSRNYFAVNPRTTRHENIAVGIGIMITGTIVAVVASIGITYFTGIFHIFTLGIALAVYGIGVGISGKFMPAKTTVGSRAYADVLGFKMYLETAERFRLQNLTPEEFEKYLSYAVTLGVEKQWAEHFKDIYKENPEWYQGTGSFTDALILSSALQSFSNATSATIRASANSASGSSWSGGGFSSGSSFGGFSGGGGGGGSVGGW